MRAVGMDECALTTGHQAFATVSIEREPIEIIASLDYRDQETLIQ
ncbi:MAG TPA: hypothetical protein VJ508_16915 [Saprospiraceae bacterium]|nr:hypothetical protein [Saprospiraceae bacterium]